MRSNNTLKVIVLLLSTILCLVLIIWGMQINEQREISTQLQEELERQKYENDLLQQDNEDLYQQVERLKRVDSAQYVKSVVMAEARGSTFEDQCAVLQTMVDRSYLWDEPIIDIVKQPGQYADPYNGEICESVDRAFSHIVAEGNRVFDQNTTHFATYEPYWAASKESRGKINRHYYWGE